MNRLLPLLFLLPVLPALAGPLEDFRAAAGRAAVAARSETPPRFAIPGRDGWFHSAPELAYLAAGDFWGEALAAKPEPRPEDPLPGILDFHAQLKERGVTLVVMPVPAKAAVHPEGLPEAIPAAGAADPALPAFLRVLEAAGVSVIDLTADYAKPAQPLFCRTDTHWSPAGIRIAAGRVDALVRAQAWHAAAAKAPLALVPADITITGDLAKSLSQTPPVVETLRIDRADGFQPDPSSPLLLLGDSHLQFLSAGGDMHATGAGFAEQVAARTGLTPDVVSRNGSAGMVRRDVIVKSRNPAWLSGKKMVVWVFTCRELTQADPGSWRPLKFPPAAR